MKVREFQSTSERSGDELIESLLEYLKDSASTSNSAATLGVIAKRDVNLAAAGLLFHTYMRQPFDDLQVETNMRYVYVMENWPSFLDIVSAKRDLTEELCGFLTNEIKEQHIQPVRAIHGFVTWSKI